MLTCAELLFGSQGRWWRLGGLLFNKDTTPGERDTHQRAGRAQHTSGPSHASTAAPNAHQLPPRRPLVVAAGGAALGGGIVGEVRGRSAEAALGCSVGSSEKEGHILAVDGEGDEAKVVGEEGASG